MGVIRQIYCTIIICCMCLNTGIIFGWPSSTINLFASNNTTLNRPMTETEISLFGSLSSFAAILSSPISSILLDLLGRKCCCILFSLPILIAWTIVSLIPRVEAILFSVFLSGISGCVFMIVPNFVSELCQENIRGILTSGNIIFYGMGLTLSYILGGCLEYHMMNYVCLTISVFSLALLSLVKESPMHLMSKGFDKAAAQSISFYRSVKPDSKIVLQDIDVLRRILSPQLNDVKSEEQALNPESQEPRKLTKLQFIIKSKSSLRALSLVCALFFFSVFQGTIVVQVYSEPLFKEALPNISANLNSILFSIVSVVFGFVGAYLTDHFGRRPVMIYPSIATFLTCIALGIQIQFQWGPSWLTAVLVYTYCIVACGAATVPYVVVAELFLPEVRGIMSTLVIEWAWLCNFLILYMFNPFIAAFGLGPVFYVFAFISLISSIFSFFYLPETKRLTVDVLQTLLLKDVNPEEETLKPENQGLKKITKLQFICQFQFFTFSYVHSEPLFKEALPNVSANLNSILFSIVNVVFGFVGWIDRFGRRPVMIYPSIATFLTCIAQGTQIQFQWGPSWLTVVLVYTYCIVTTCGATTVPYVMVAKLFLPEVRGIMSMVAIECAWLCNFLILSMFNPFIAAFGLGPVFYVFAFISLISSIFSFFYLPETKGLTVDVLQILVLKGKQY